MRRFVPRPHGARPSPAGRRAVGAGTLLLASLLAWELSSASGAAASPSVFVLRSVAPIPGTTIVLRTSVPVAAGEDEEELHVDGTRTEEGHHDGHAPDEGD